MPDFPPPIASLVSRLRREALPLAWIEIDDAGVILATGGELESFSLEQAARGDCLNDYGIYLEEMLPQRREPFRLVDLELPTGTYSTVYIQTVEESNWIILQDRTAQAMQSLWRSQNRNRLDGGDGS